MGGGGFEPPKQVAADLQSVPFGHSGIHPYSIHFELLAFQRMDRGGFEPPKQDAADLQSVPFGLSGICP